MAMSTTSMPFSNYGPNLDTQNINQKPGKQKKYYFPFQGKTLIKPTGPPWDEPNIVSFPITVKGYDRVEEIRAATFLPLKGFLLEIIGSTPNYAGHFCLVVMKS